LLQTDKGSGSLRGYGRPGLNMRIVTLFEEQAFASTNGNPLLMMHKVGDLPKGANRPSFMFRLLHCGGC